MQADKLTPITGSSQIAAIGHDGIALFVQFHSSPVVYRYRPKADATEHGADKLLEHHAAIMAADSAGKYFNANIRGKFDSEKLAVEPTAVA